ncbi:hypothetical protein D9M68_869560 [compost metagenome]
MRRRTAGSNLSCNLRLGQGLPQRRDGDTERLQEAEFIAQCPDLNNARILDLENHHHRKLEGRLVDGTAFDAIAVAADDALP